MTLKKLRSSLKKLVRLSSLSKLIDEVRFSLIDNQWAMNGGLTG